MRTLIILTTTTMGITHMASFRSIMISMTFIISTMMDTLVIALVAVILVVILIGVTAVVFMAGEDGLNRQTEAGAFAPVFFTRSCKKQAVDDQEKNLTRCDDPAVF